MNSSEFLGDLFPNKGFGCSHANKKFPFSGMIIDEEVRSSLNIFITKYFQRGSSLMVVEN